MSLLGREEKERILRSLEEDREFRYALMGLLGYRELLDRFARLEERQQRLEERQQRLEEHFARLEERFAKLEERVIKLEERQQRLEERFAKLEELVIEVRKQQQRLEERVTSLEGRVNKLDAMVSALAHRFGVISEEGLRDALKFVVEDVYSVGSVDRLILKDNEGVIFAKGEVVEIDVVVHDGEHILLEFKSRVDKWDVYLFHRKGLLYERVKGVKPRLVMVAGFVEADAWPTAARLGIELRPVSSLG